MLPADQGLQAAEMTIRQIRHGLVEQAKLLLLNGLEQSLLQQHPLPWSVPSCRGVEQIAVAATALGFMHGVVRRADEAVRGLAMLRIEETPMLAESLTRSWPMSAGSCSLRCNPSMRPSRSWVSLMAGSNTRNSSAPSRMAMSRAQAVANAVCRQLEQQIAGTVPQVVVDELEAVEIDEQQRQDVVVHPWPSLSPG